MTPSPAAPSNSPSARRARSESKSSKIREIGSDQGCAVLITNLKQRVMLENALVVWGGEFGRTDYSKGALTKDNYGRDLHSRCLTALMAGGGVKAGHTYGATDDCGDYIVGPDGQAIDPSKDHYTPGAVHVHDFHATLLHQLGIDHTRSPTASKAAASG